MVEYKCENCGKQFGNRKSNYLSHINKINKCKSDNLIFSKSLNLLNFNSENELNNQGQVENDKLNSLKCVNCNKIFTRKDNLIQHQNNTCKKLNRIK
jgi:uncharacterized C2H2 Zn-finger protein